MDHGGDIDRARAAFGGAAEAWIDLSTGINPRSFPLPPISAQAWAALPTASAMSRVLEAAAAAYGAQAPIAALAGAQAGIEIAPHLRGAGCARVLAPTYNEHAAALQAAGWRVGEVDRLEALAGADFAVVVNPNNPDGMRHRPEALTDLAGDVGFLLVDESFADPHPELSIVPTLRADADRVLVLRSFGKFYGLAGLRLGFAIGGAADIAAIKRRLGPWPVSGPALEIAAAALADRKWRDETVLRLAADARRLDGLAIDAGWRVAGGTTLFRLYDAGDAAAAQRRLAHGHVWSRIFPWSRRLIRLGLPDGDAAWRQVAAALA